MSNRTDQERRFDAISDCVREILTSVLIVFVVLKIDGTIDWPWAWVLCPLWLPAVLILVLLFASAVRRG